MFNVHLINKCHHIHYFVVSLVYCLSPQLSFVQSTFSFFAHWYHAACYFRPVLFFFFHSFEVQRDVCVVALWKWKIESGIFTNNQNKSKTPTKTKNHSFFLFFFFFASCQHTKTNLVRQFRCLMKNDNTYTNRHIIQQLLHFYFGRAISIYFLSFSLNFKTKKLPNLYEMMIFMLTAIHNSHSHLVAICSRLSFHVQMIRSFREMI